MSGVLYTRKAGGVLNDLCLLLPCREMLVDLVYPELTELQEYTYVVLCTACVYMYHTCMYVV